MTSASFVAEVDDGGEQTFGQEVCSNFLQAGWSEDQSAEQSEASAASASAASSAAAAATAARQQQNATDQRNAIEALGTLSHDDNFTADLSAIAGDAKQTGTDLAATRADASNGQGDTCDNVVTAQGDAAVTVEGDVDVTFSGDIQSLTFDIGTVRADVRTVRADIRALQDDGLAEPSGSDGAISQASTAIGVAISTANSDVDAVNADLVAAYGAANALATGSCEGEGPGQPPTPIAHIK